MPKSAALPLAPLEEKVRVMADLPDSSSSHEGGGGFSDKLFGEMCGVSARAIARWRQAANQRHPEGELPWPSADLAATRLGVHPVSIWGSAWTDLDRAVLVPDKDMPKALRKAIEADMKQIEAIMAAQADAIACDGYEDLRLHMTAFPELYVRRDRRVHVHV